MPKKRSTKKIPRKPKAPENAGTEKPKRSAAQIRADKAYRKKNRATICENQRENFGNIAATFQKPEKEYIAAIFAAHGVKPAEVIRGAAAALRDGQTIRTERQALPIPADAAQTATAPDKPEKTE